MMEEPEDPGRHTRKCHHVVATTHSAAAGAKHPGLCIMKSHHGTIISQDMKEEADDLGHQGMHAYDNEDEEVEMEAPCFTRRVHRMQVPKGFKLPHDQQKYDSSQEPQSWLSDYLQAVKILRGSKETAMQSLQLHLTGA
jgi:hypothetical protein